MKKKGLFREPWKYNDEDIRSLCHFTKLQFFKQVEQQSGAWSAKCEMNLHAETLLWLMKLTQIHSFEELSTFFGLDGHQTASNIFYRHLIYHFANNVNVKNIVGIDGLVNQSEIDQLYQEIYDRTPEYEKKLLENFQDPANRDRIPVVIGTDCTYIGVCHPEDVDLQKSLWFGHRAEHTVKVANFTDATGKIVAMLPLASSQSPSSGNLLKMYSQFF